MLEVRGGEETSDVTLGDALIVKSGDKEREGGGTIEEGKMLERRDEFEGKAGIEEEGKGEGPNRLLEVRVGEETRDVTLGEALIVTSGS